METAFTRKHYSAIGVRQAVILQRMDGSVNDDDIFRFERDMDLWASKARAAEVGVPEGEGWMPVGNPHVDSGNPRYVVQMWQRDNT
jgi:hypothetical protein